LAVNGDELRLMKEAGRYPPPAPAGRERQFVALNRSLEYLPIAETGKFDFDPLGI
jgi:hypothetical protein